MNQEIELIALCPSGLEGAASLEIKNNNYKIIDSTAGKVTFAANFKDIPNILTTFKTIDRVLIKIKQFKAYTFDELFDHVYSINWSDYIGKRGKIVVEKLKINNSKISATGAVASVILKAVYESLKQGAKKTYYSEDSDIIYPLYVYLKNDVVTICLDTVYKESLARRGYRINHLSTSLRETIAASLIVLSRWSSDYKLVDPFCGSGTIPIEAALMASNYTPKRTYACEKWDIFKDMGETFNKNFSKNNIDYSIYGYDKSYKAIEMAKVNAELANVKVYFEKRAMESLQPSNERIYFISNLPYGINLPDNIQDTYKKMRHLPRSFPNGKFFFITSEANFEEYFGKKADKKFRFQNNGIWVWFYMFYSE